MQVNGKSAIGSDFRRSVLWQKAQELATNLATTIRDLPRDRAADVIGNQLLRSGTSIAANIAEGYGRYSQAAYRNHLSIARGSAFETESWLDRLIRTGYVSSEAGEKLIGLCTEAQKLITARMKSLDGGKTYAVREDAVDYETQ